MTTHDILCAPLNQVSLQYKQRHFKKEGLYMCTIQIRVQCPDEFFEVVPNELEHAELTVEELVSQALVELFGTVLVEDVTIRFPQPDCKCRDMPFP